MHRVRHLNDRLPPLELLNTKAILGAMDERGRVLVSHLEILEDVGSTNLYLLNKASREPASGHVCLAEKQHAGRGQRGRTWVSPFASNVYLSIMWRFESCAPLGLSIAMGVAVARALETMGIADIGLKWPNDVLWQERKLAGILIDTTTQASGACHAVVGVGLNVAMPAQQAPQIDQPWIDMEEILDRPVERNPCAGLLLQQLLLALQEFQATGLPAFQDEWANLDLLAGRQVILQTPSETTAGVAAGIDTEGSFKLLANDIIRHYRFGEVSVKLRDKSFQKRSSAVVI